MFEDEYREYQQQVAALICRSLSIPASLLFGDNMTDTQVETFNEWAIVDVMGHQRFVGKVSEQVIAGQGFVRVDIPATSTTPAWTKLIGTASIYAITPVSEEIARGLNIKRPNAPVQAYELPSDAKQDAKPAGYIEVDPSDFRDGWAGTKSTKSIDQVPWNTSKQRILEAALTKRVYALYYSNHK